MLHVFGDSFTDFYPSRDKLNWSKLLSEELGCELNNQGLVGCTNSHILTKIINNLSSIQPTDYVIIQLSGPGRMDVPLSNNESKTIYASDIGNYNSIIKKNKGYEWGDDEWKIIEDYFINFHSIGYHYQKDIENIIKIADYIYKKITKNVILWNICPLGDVTTDKFNDNMSNIIMDDTTINNGYHMWLDNPKVGWIERIDKEKKSIFHDTNNEVIDYHLSENGHEWLSRLILKKIKLWSLL